MSSHRRIPGVLAAVLALALAACGGDAGTDGGGEAPALTEPRLTLAIEGVALPEGVSAGDLVVEPVALEGPSSGDGATVAAFRLGPDGLVFATPLSVTIELPASAIPAGEGVTFVLFLTSSDGTAEMLAVDDAQRDPADGTIRLAASVPHFSELRVVSAWTPITIDVTPAPGEDFAVGSRFTVSTVVHRPRTQREDLHTTVTFSDGSNRIVSSRYSSDPGPWTSQTWWVVNDGSADGMDAFVRNPPRSVAALTPAETNPSRTTHADTASATPAVAQEFRCERPGPFRILFYARVDQRGTQTIVGDDNRRFPVMLTTAQEVVAMTGRCVQGTSTPTPTPTGSPTPTSTPAVAEGPWEAILEGGETVDGPLHTIVRGQVIVFVLDGVPFATEGLQVVEAHPPFCAYTHVHGGPIRSIVPASDGRYVDRAEHLAECGYGAPDFRIIRDPR
ncbi:MAG: hypothetical protein Q7K37_01045 [Dehalococcoidia bacterium]|nr:hypothetical protein [Dehalococcoidia bacterium]